jgi:hypothetical protein
MIMLSRQTSKGASAPTKVELTSLVYGSLVRMLGHTNAEAIEFYIDTRMAIDDPERYETSVKRLLGDHGGNLIINGIKTELAAESGTERSSERLLTQVRAAQNALVRPPFEWDR